jgi:hypothetical protein
LVSVNNRLAGIIALADTVKENTKEAVVPRFTKSYGTRINNAYW